MTILHILLIIPLSVIIVCGVAFIIGGVQFMKSPETDDSNLFNYLRVFGHIAKHPGDLGRLYYISKEGEIGKRAFPYIDKDEYSEVVRTRP